jgi:hypothetical protein
MLVAAPEIDANLSDWEANLNSVAHVRGGSAPEGVYGISMMIDVPRVFDHDDKNFIPDSAVRWVVMLPVWARHWFGSEQDVLATYVTRTVDQCGLPLISGRRPLLNCDFRARPAPSRGAAVPFGPLDHVAEPNLCYVMNGLWEGLIGAAFTHNHFYRSLRRNYLAARQLPPKADKFHFHGPRESFPSETAPAVADVFPVPYLSFEEKREERHLSSRRCFGVTSKPRVHAADFPSALKWEFLRSYAAGLPITTPRDGVFVRQEAVGDGSITALIFREGESHFRVHVPSTAAPTVIPDQEVKAGHIVTYAARTTEPDEGPSFDEVMDELGSTFRPTFEAWAEGLLVRFTRYPGRVYARADLVAAAASAARRGEIVWDLDPASSLFDDAVMAYRFPPLMMVGQLRELQSLPGEVRVDPWPQDHRFCLHGRVTRNKPLRERASSPSVPAT